MKMQNIAFLSCALLYKGGQKLCDHLPPHCLRQVRFFFGAASAHEPLRAQSSSQSFFFHPDKNHEYGRLRL